jgi:hypothetical protein
MARRGVWGMLACGLIAAGVGERPSLAMGHRIAGKSAEEVFQAPHLAELANAACDGDVKGIERAIGAGAAPNGLSIDGGSPLLWTVYCNNPKGVEALLKAGADPNLKARDKYSPTLAAATARDPRILLAHGGDPYADDGHLWSALRLAFSYGKYEGRWDNYYTLLNSGIDINRLDVGRVTIAFYASENYDKLEELLDRGYTRDLEYIGGLVQMGNYPPNSPQIQERQKLEDRLTQMGVHFPVPPLGRGMQ